MSGFLQLAPKVFRTACQGESHTFTLTPDGDYDNPHHDLESDAVMVALGSEVHMCGRLYGAYLAARDVFAAERGEHDVPGAEYCRNGWATKWEDSTHTCRNCFPSLKHISGCAHHASKHATERDLVEWMLNWLYEGAGFPQSPQARTQQAIADLQTVMPGAPAPMHLRLLRDALVTAEFVKAARPLLPRNIPTLAGHLVFLREEGVRVEWLRSVTTHVDPEQAHQFAADPKKSLYALAQARDDDPQEVAEQINEGKFVLPMDPEYSPSFEGLASALMDSAEFWASVRGEPGHVPPEWRTNQPPAPPRGTRWTRKSK